METSENLNEIAKALSLLQGKMKPASLDGNNPFFKSKYSTLLSVWDALKDHLLESQICIVQDAITTDLGITVSTRVIHASGQWMQFGPLSIPLAKKDAHSIGSSLTYAKRYSISAALGVVCDDDDDGNKATAAAPKVKPEASKEEIDLFLNEYSKKYSKDDILNFLESQSKAFGYTKGQIVFLANQKQSAFEEKIKSFLGAKDE